MCHNGTDMYRKPLGMIIQAGRRTSVRKRAKNRQVAQRPANMLYRARIGADSGLSKLKPVRKKKNVFGLR